MGGRRKKRRSPETSPSKVLGDRPRSQLAELAARLMVEGGLRDFALAKAKAAERMGISKGLPSNAEIEQALIDYQQLFRADSHDSELRDLRLIAREAMQFFQRFDPQLTGAVLSGSAGPHATIELHLFSDAPEAVGVYLDEQHFPYEIEEKRFKDGRGGYEFFPAYVFVVDETPLEAVVLPLDKRRHSPISLIDGRPMRRLDRKGLEQLLAVDAEPPATIGQPR